MKLKSFCILIGFFVLEAQSKVVVVPLHCPTPFHTHSPDHPCYPVQPVTLSVDDTIKLTCNDKKECPGELNDILHLEFPSGSSLGKIPKDIFGRLRKLKTLQFVNVGIRELKKGDFEGANELRSLVIEGNQISEIPAGAFSGAAKLKTLRLSENGINSIECGAFESSTLSILIAADNKLSSLAKGVFSGATNLEYIDLACNSIETIEKGTFNTNHLGVLPIGGFQNKLQMLLLTGNQLNEVMDALEGSTSLKHLLLSGNPFTEQILSKLQICPTLNNLKLNNANQILPESIKPGHPLKSLSLKNNNLSDSRALEKLSALSALIYLNLDDNKFAKLDHFTEIGNPNCFPNLKLLDDIPVTSLESYCKDKGIECN